MLRVRLHLLNLDSILFVKILPVTFTKKKKTHYHAEKDVLSEYYYYYTRWEHIVGRLRDHPVTWHFLTAGEHD